MAVDRFADTLVAHGSAPGALDELGPLLAAGAGAARLYAKAHPREVARLTAGQRAAVAPAAPAWGEPVERVTVVENGVRYAIRPGAGLSVGLFLDMREVRAWVRGQAADRTVLNLFAYTCAFGACATLGGAARVLNVDTSRPYLAWGQENYAGNDLAVDPRDFVHGDAQDWLGRLARRGERFDMVVLDPPSFGRTRGGAFSVERDYARLVAAAARATAPQGILVAATNHHGVSPGRFDAFVDRGVHDARRAGRRIRRWHEPAIDFPTAPGDWPHLHVQALVLN